MDKRTKFTLTEAVQLGKEWAGVRNTGKTFIQFCDERGIVPDTLRRHFKKMGYATSKVRRMEAYE